MKQQDALPSGPHVDLVAEIRRHRTLSSDAAHEFLKDQRIAAQAGQLAPAVLADAALHLLETLTEKDGWLDMAAAAILIEWGEARHLERLRAVRPKLRPRVALRDWRLEVSRAIDVIAARTQTACDCSAHAGHGAPVYGPQWAVENTVVHADLYATVYTVRCTRCQRLWSVEEESSYHYPVFTWRDHIPAK